VSNIVLQPFLHILMHATSFVVEDVKEGSITPLFNATVDFVAGTFRNTTASLSTVMGILAPDPVPTDNASSATSTSTDSVATPASTSTSDLDLTTSVNSNLVQAVARNYCNMFTVSFLPFLCCPSWLTSDTNQIARALVSPFTNLGDIQDSRDKIDSAIFAFDALIGASDVELGEAVNSWYVIFSLQTFVMSNQGFSL
jgi:hypothetical protein